MFKVVTLLTRHGALTRDEFRAWLLGPHASLARQLPGLRKYVLNLVEGEDAGIDGMAEVWFDSREAFDAAYATAIGVDLASDSGAHLSGRVRLYVDEQPQLG